MEDCQVHNLEVEGSIPSPATCRGLKQRRKSILYASGMFLNFQNDKLKKGHFGKSLQNVWRYQDIIAGRYKSAGNALFGQ